MSDQTTREAAGSRTASDAAPVSSGAANRSANEPPTGRHAPIAWLIAGLLALGLAGAAGSLMTARDDGTTFDLRGWRNGTLGRQIDRAIDVPYARALHGWEAAVRYRLFGDLGPQVKEGCPGWLFFRDGLRPMGDAIGPRADSADAGDDTLADARIATLHAYAEALQNSGIRLVVVTVPDKARVETGALCGLQQASVMTRRLARWQLALDKAGVTPVDLLPVLQQPQPTFYRTDVHWNARGADAAAQAVADAVLPLLGKRGDTRYAHAQASAAPRVGDLLKLADLDGVPDGWRPAPDIDAEETLTPIRAGGLLDAGAPAEVLLAGSSFSRRSAFAERLGERLGREIWNESLDDGQFDRALRGMWAKRASWPASVRVVIWEMSEDALSMPADAAPPSLPSPAHTAASSTDAARVVPTTRRD